MKRLAATIAILLSLSLNLRAQFFTPLDTTAVKRSEFRATQLIAPSALIATGAIVHFAAHEAIEVPVKDCFQGWRAGRPERDFDNYLQYAPVVLDLGLGFLGAEAEHGFWDRLIEASIAYVSLGASSGLLKEIVNSPRPNGVDNKSFPSGHSDLVFAGAELVRMEYGWGWGSAAYAAATTVAVMRLYNNWHWAGDVVAGAGLGILCAHVGGWLLEPVKGVFGINTTVAPVVDPVSGTVLASVNLKF